MPIRLDYDTLPRRSRVRREVNQDGSVTITAPPGEVGSLARSEAQAEALWRSALVCGLFSFVALWLFQLYFGDRIARLDRGLFAVLVIAAATFLGGVFLLVWRSLYQRAGDALERSSHQMSAVRVGSGFLAVELSGPTQARSVTVRQPFDLRLSRTIDGLWCLRLDAPDEQPCDLFCGMSVPELRWLGAEISRLWQGSGGALDTPDFTR